MLTRLHRAAGAAAAATAAAAWLAAAPPLADTKSSKAILLARTPSETQGKKPALAPGVELLVHNISHADLICTLEDVGKDPSDDDEGVVLARPLFNSFMPISLKVMEQLDRLRDDGEGPSVKTVPSTYRVTYPAGLDLVGETDGLVLPVAAPTDTSSPRDDADPAALKMLTRSQFNIRGRKGEVGEPSARVTSVYLPLVAMVIPEWIRAIKKRAFNLPPDAPAPRKVRHVRAHAHHVCSHAHAHGHHACVLAHAAHAHGRMRVQCVLACACTHARMHASRKVLLLVSGTYTCTYTHTYTRMPLARSCCS